MNRNKTRIAVFVSGTSRGSNMQAIIDACCLGVVNAEVALVMGTKEQCPAIDRARAAGVMTMAISPKNFTDNTGYAEALLRALYKTEIDLVCLAGYMSLLPPEVIAAFRNRIMNIHPALIPMFCGSGMYGHHVHEAAIQRGVKVSGVTVHFVDERYDNGPIIIQRVVPVIDGDTSDTLAARVLLEEHSTYVDAVGLFAEGKLTVEGRRINILPSPVNNSAC